PTVRPRRPMAKIGPNADGARPQSSAILGATKAIDWVSKPSSMAMMKHSAVTPNCSGPNLARSMTAFPPPSPMAAICVVLLRRARLSRASPCVDGVSEKGSGGGRADLDVERGQAADGHDHGVAFD